MGVRSKLKYRFIFRVMDTVNIMLRDGLVLRVRHSEKCRFSFSVAVGIE